MTGYIRRKVRTTEEQELVVYETYNKQEYQYSEEHYHPRPLTLFREHAQLENAAKEEFVDEEFPYKHTQTDGEQIHEDL